MLNLSIECFHYYDEATQSLNLDIFKLKNELNPWNIFKYFEIKYTPRETRKSQQRLVHAEHSKTMYCGKKQIQCLVVDNDWSYQCGLSSGICWIACSNPVKFMTYWCILLYQNILRLRPQDSNRVFHTHTMVSRFIPPKICKKSICYINARFIQFTKCWNHNSVKATETPNRETRGCKKTYSYKTKLVRRDNQICFCKIA